MNRRPTQLTLAATAIAATALLTACGTESSDADAASTPTTSAPVSTPATDPVATPSSTPAKPGGVTRRNLLTDAHTVYAPDAADWFTVDTFRGDGQAVFNPCAPGSLTETGATSVHGREFELRNLDTGAPEVHGDFLT